MRRERKFEIVEELKDILASSDTIIVADYRGLDVEGINSFRKNCRNAGVTFRVVKNTLVKRAVEETEYADIEDLFEGPTAISVRQGDPMILVKLVADFAKGNDFFNIKGGVVNGDRMTTEDVFRAATLPPREVLLSNLVGSLNYPISGFVGTLAAILRNLICVMDALRQSKDRR